MPSIWALSDFPDQPKADIVREQRRYQLLPGRCDKAARKNLSRENIAENKDNS
jgi:hypothetical protein